MLLNHKKTIMRRTIYFHLSILLLLTGGASVYSQRSMPAQLVRELYTAHDAGNGPFSQPPARARIDMFFTPRLGNLLWKEANNKTGEVGALDGDPLYNAQDMDIRSFKIAKAVINGTTSTVPVSFTNVKKKERLTFVLKRVGKEWKIDDIKYSPSDTLYKWLKKTYP
jgi:hypothetical protein